MKDPWNEWTVRQAATAGAEATFRFRGTGVALVGTMTQAGGRADVFLDGQKAGEIDACIPPNTNDNDLWHATGLASGEHTVRVVMRADQDARSDGHGGRARAGRRLRPLNEASLGYRISLT